MCAGSMHMRIYAPPYGNRRTRLATTMTPHALATFAPSLAMP